MRSWLTYLKLGKAIYAILRKRHPQLDEVPVEDVIDAITTVVESTKTVADTRVVEATPGEAPPRLRVR